MNKINVMTGLFLLGTALLLTGCEKNDEQQQTVEPGVVPATLSDTLKIKRSSKIYIINGIGISGSNTVAIINNEVVAPGAELDPGVTLDSIHPTYAVIQIKDKKHMIRPESIQQELDNK